VWGWRLEAGGVKNMKGRLDRAALSCLGNLPSRFEASDAHIGFFAFMQKDLKLSLQYCKTMF